MRINVRVYLKLYIYLGCNLSTILVHNFIVIKQLNFSFANTRRSYMIANSINLTLRF
jgi:hypothetical protein